MKPISPFGLPIGISAAFWAFIGLIRFVIEKYFNILKNKDFSAEFTLSDIAVILPAHNEEIVIRKCIQALKLSFDVKHIHVVSDGSADKTYRRARMEGCHVSYLNPGRGKAKALVYLINKFNLYKRYKLIFIIDADTRIDKDFIKNTLPVFKDSEIGVVFASSRIKWPKHIFPKISLYFVAYRERLNRLLQYVFIYGQTWKYTNVNYVIPGFATIYRSKILKKLQIDTNGLLIEDFNLAFQFHKKKLGKIGYAPSAIGWDQYPENLADYWKQVQRWNIGFFQTVKKNGVWLSFFWLALGLFSFEVILNSVFILLLPLLLIFLLSPFFPDPIFSNYTNLYQEVQSYNFLSFKGIFIGVFLIDYLITVVIGLVNKKPQFIIYGLFFFFLHFITSFILISSIIPGFFGKSNGRWISPKRSAT